MTKRDPFRPVDDEARAQAAALLSDARYGALGTLRDGLPVVTRAALAPTRRGLLTLVSDLAAHAQAMRSAPQVSLMIGEPGRGDPLAHPRMTIAATARFVDKAPHRDAYLSCQPKAALYIDFADFNIVHLDIDSAELNGGFGKAYRLTKADLTLPQR